MISVCHITNAHDPEDVRIFHKECVSLAKNGYDVTLVERGDSYEKNGVHIIGIGQPNDGRLNRMTKFAQKAYEAAVKIDADLYHFHDPELLPFGLKLKKSGKIVIFDSHEHTAESILEKEWIPGVLQHIVYNLFSAYQRFVCRQLDAIVTVTPNLTEYFEKINPHTYQVTNYPILEVAEKECKDEGNHLVFAGGINPIWHHEIILDALVQNPDCHYYLCGGGDKEYLKKLRDKPGWQQTEFLGKIPHDEVADVMARSTVGVALDSYCRNSDGHNGTMGNTKIFEEMMAGLPVLCTDFVRWREFVDRWNCGICVDPDNVTEVSDAIRYLLDHPNEAEQMGRNAQQAVKEEFNWDTQAKILLEMYQDILEGKLS